VTSGAAGKILDGKYELLQRLGGGGMGDIFLVRHLHLEQKRVVKILREELARDAVAQQRFLREARLATHVKHSNVAILYDYAQLEDQSFYMVWEFIDGMDIGEFLEKEGPVPLDTALKLAVQVLRGLEAIHSAGVVHRDISPDNIMVTRDNRDRLVVKIIDLGLAKGLTPDPRHEVTEAGMFMGKLRYCSPEQAEMGDGPKLDARADLYSFALVLYEMLTGMTPFEADSPAAYVFKRLSEDALPISDRNAQIQLPKALDEIFSKALQRKREDRYPDAIRFIEALEPVAARLGTMATQQIVPIASAADKAPGSRIREPSVSRISGKERSDLLAQIDMAARKVKETSRLLKLANQALDQEDLDRARELRRKLADLNPRVTGLADLTVRLLAAEEGQDQKGREASQAAAVAPVGEEPVSLETPTPSEDPKPLEEKIELIEEDAGPILEIAEEPEPRGEVEEEAPVTPEQVRAAEEMLEGYLRDGRVELAALALESLLDLNPNHSKGDEYKSWIRMAGEEAETRQRGQDAVSEGRRCLEQADLKGARKQLDLARRHDPEGESVLAFEEEVESIFEQRNQGQLFEGLKKEFDKAVRAGELEDAEEALQEMTDLGLSKVSLTFYASQLDQARQQRRQEDAAAPFRKRVEESVARGEFEEAREAVHALSEALPDSTLTAGLLSLIEEREQQQRQKESIAQGLQQVEGLLDAGNTTGASLGLKILQQMDPENSRLRSLEKRLLSMKS